MVESGPKLSVAVINHGHAVHRHRISHSHDSSTNIAGDKDMQLDVQWLKTLTSNWMNVS